MVGPVTVSRPLVGLEKGLSTSDTRLMWDPLCHAATADIKRDPNSKIAQKCSINSSSSSSSNNNGESFKVKSLLCAHL